MLAVFVVGVSVSEVELDVVGIPGVPVFDEGRFGELEDVVVGGVVALELCVGDDFVARAAVEDIFWDFDECIFEFVDVLYDTGVFIC